MSLSPCVKISSGALLNNFRRLKELSGQLALFPVIKANAYGHGIFEVASILEAKTTEAEAPYFCVARGVEAEFLRSKGIRRPLLILSEFERVSKASMETLCFSIHCLGDLKLLLKNAQVLGLEVHLNVNTGMNRLGFLWTHEAEMIECLNLIEAHGVKLSGVMSHLARAEESPKNFSQEQVRRFEQVTNFLRDLHHPALRNWKWTHLCNSPGIVRAVGDLAKFCNAARPGVHLWGASADQSFRLDQTFKAVAEVSAPIRQIFSVKAQEGLGYGHRFVAKRDSIVGTVALGYADGVPRQLSRHADEAWRIGFVINGCRVPIIGTVSMDLIMLDLSDLPEAPNWLRSFQNGETVSIEAKWICAEQPVEEIASAVSTISYELLCALNQRLERKVYD